jgi:hypothetical protein
VSSTPIEAPERRRNRSLAALALAVCYGVSAFFLTGDGGAGILTALVVVALFGAMLLFAPRLVEAGRPVSSYYLLGLSIVVVPLVLLAVGDRWTPWYDLQGRYPATGPAPAGLDGGPEVVLVLPVDEVMVRPYRFRRARVAFADDGVHLELAWPMSVVYDPLWIPLGAIRLCGESGLDPMYTSLAVAGTAAKIEVVDAGDPLLGWCRERGIDDGLDHTPGLLR